MKLVPAALEDADLISNINVQAFDDERNNFGPWKDGEGPKWYYGEWYSDIEQVKKLIKEFHYYMIIEDEIIVGSFWLHDIDETTIELEDFCIIPQYQGNGYGYKAILLMETLCPMKKRWILGTPFYSVRNHHLYEKAGYTKTGVTAEDMVFMYEKIVS